MNLSDAQWRHLKELAAIYGKKGMAFWTPFGPGEKRCAEGLARRGLLVGHNMPYSKTQYELTQNGLDAVSATDRSEDGR